MAAKDKERMMLEEARNKLESYIYKVKNKLEDDLDQISKVSTEEQRESSRKLALDAEEWMYEDGYGADLKTLEAKYAELSVPFDKVLLRLSELTARPAALEALKKRLTEIEQLMATWATDRPQVTEEERNTVLEKVEGIRQWVIDQEAAQAAKKPHEDPAFLSVDVPNQTKLVEALVVRLGKKPKPKPAKKNETKAENATTAGANATADGANATESANATAADNDANATSDGNSTDSGNATDGDAAEGDEL